MKGSQRSSLTIGIILVLVGSFFILTNLVPELKLLLNFEYSWPMILFAVAVGLLILGLIVGAPGMAIPATIVGGIGGILYYQNFTGNWESWSYLWTLIPGFSGLGMILAFALGARKKVSIPSALDTIGTSLVLFVIFGAFFGAFKVLGPYWPLLLVAAGVLIGLRTLLKPHA
ncbi:MAG: hypothetical protein NTZ74_13350 [Chloroflexi bacterium]|nr:hypothetical protein [Chloroflexota bacterium]